ncbi:hypothetical protein V5O48_012860 [Marasmius crinis-equi]|uniref:DDE-1 domain-containing protein n=1 Tax=Marasmius crinis-equi TaxID=585013 RepID=A0ABR3F1X3_9AGAR
MSNQLKPVTGLSQHLIERIHHLASLMRGLPDSLPLNPPASESTYHFELDPDEFEDRGVLGTISRVLEITFGQERDGIIVFTERGTRVEENLPKMIKLAVKEMNDGDRQVFAEAWLERLIRSAKDCGAKVLKKRKKRTSGSGSDSDDYLPANPTKKSKPEILEISDDDDDDDDDTPEILPSSPSTPFYPNSPQKPRPSVATKQTTLSFMKDARSEQEKRADRVKAMKAADKAKEKWEEKVQKEKQTKAEREKEQNRIRQQRFRAKQKAQKDRESSPEGRGVNDALMEGAREQGQGTVMGQTDRAGVSRAGYEEWREERGGTKRGAVVGQARRTNWFHPFLWSFIERAMKHCDWSPTDTAKFLQRQNPALFSNIRRQTIGKWKEVGARQWTKKTLDCISYRHALVASGRVGALTQYPQLIGEIKTTIISLRTSGLIVNVPIARSIILGFIQQRHPEILTGSKFTCSERYVRDFMQSVLDFSPRQGTRAAAKLPDDADDVCERTFFRLVYAMMWEKIPPKLVINADQMGIYVLPSSSSTWHTRGDRQVDIVAKEEKRAFTLMVASTPTGVLLPFQAVWPGKTKNSLPSQKAEGMDKAQEYGFQFTFAASEKNPRSHFSTLKTMKEWIKDIFLPYMRSVIEADPDLDDDQKGIIFIDAYPVHTSKSFITHVFEEYPNIILIFVPHNCTGKFQPADVGLQRPIKHFIKQILFMWMAEMHKQQIKEGKSPKEIKVSTSLPFLRDASVDPLMKAYEWMQGPDGRDLIFKAWKNSTAKNWNLSAECLTSKEAQTALKTYLKSDKDLFTEIQNRCGLVHGMGESEMSEESCAEADIDAEHIEDDTDVPLAEVVSEMLQPRNEAGQHAYRRGDHGGLVAAAEEEDVWAYDDTGRPWASGGTIPTVDDGDDD